VSAASARVFSASRRTARARWGSGSHPGEGSAEMASHVRDGSGSEVR
jgi:hypothetical protein